MTMTMSRPRPTRDQLRESLREHANTLREDANFVASHWQCDDAAFPYSLDLPWADWVEFMEKTVIPFIELDMEDPEAEQALLAEFRQASAAYIMTSMYFMWQRLKTAEAQIDRDHVEGADAPTD